MLEISIFFNCVIDQRVGYAKIITLLSTLILGEEGIFKPIEKFDFAEAVRHQQENRLNIDNNRHCYKT